jgi:hypothetical protein
MFTLICPIEQPPSISVFSYDFRNSIKNSGVMLSMSIFDFLKEDNIPLCLQNDNTLQVFSENEPVYCSEFADLVPESAGRFIHINLVSKFVSLQFRIAYAMPIGIKKSSYSRMPLFLPISSSHGINDQCNKSLRDFINQSRDSGMVKVCIVYLSLNSIDSFFSRTESINGKVHMEQQSEKPDSIY